MSDEVEGGAGATCTHHWLCADLADEVLAARGGATLPPVSRGYERRVCKRCDEVRDVLVRPLLAENDVKGRVEAWNG